MTTERSAFCCATPSSWCLWGAAFLSLYGVALFAVELWPALRGFDQALVLTALGIACLVNFRVSRTFYCGITGPLFLAAAAIVALGEWGLWTVNYSMVWALLMVGLGAAVFLEWRVTSSAPQS